MYSWGRKCLILQVLAVTVGLAAEPPDPPPLVVRIGGITLRPGGFFELIGETRTQTDPDSISTRFGSIPLADTAAETVASPAHSRVFLHGDRKLGKALLTAYAESDFLNPVANSAPYRWRQYWGSVRAGAWELLGGQAWSLLRPNRTGVATEQGLMNTDVIEPAYHVGLAGARRRQVRLVRNLGRQDLAVAWENNGIYVAKLAADRAFGHVEAAAFNGRSRRRGASIAAVIPASSKVRLVTQQMWSHRDIAEALNLVPPLVGGMATLEGVEAQLRRYFEVYAYAGMVYGDRSGGNRTVRQTSTGFNYRVPTPQWHGWMLFSLQYSYLDRAVWDGHSGAVHYLMYRMRFTLI